MYDSHASSSAAACGFDEDGVLDGVGTRVCVCGVCEGSLAIGNEGELELLSHFFCMNFVSHDVDMFGAGSDEDHALFFDHAREVGIFCEESDSGMDGVDGEEGSGFEESGNGEVAFCGRGSADADGVIGKANVHGLGVCGGVYGIDFDIEVAASANNSDGDFASVGDKDTFEHGV